MRVFEYIRINRLHKNARAFSLLEMLVVVAVVTLLIGIFSPSMHAALQMARVNTSKALIVQLDSACKYYYTDFQAYPPSDVSSYLPGKGETNLPVLLTGYGLDDGDNAADNWDGSPNLVDDDGHNVYGFRLKARSAVRGPYNGAENADMHKPQGSVPGENCSDIVFWDSLGNVIYYWSYDDAASQYNSDDTCRAPDYLSDLEHYRRDFILMSVGINGVWDDGTDSTGGTSEDFWDESKDSGEEPQRGYNDLGNFLSQ